LGAELNPTVRVARSAPAMDRESTRFMERVQLPSFLKKKSRIGNLGGFKIGHFVRAFKALLAALDEYCFLFL
jgi:hypothetical protein